MNTAPHWSESVVASGLAGLKRLSGYYHENFIAQHDGQDYLIRIVRPDADQMDYRTMGEGDVLAFLAAQNFPAPRVLYTSNAQHYTVQQYIAGMTLSELYPREKPLARPLIERVGQMMARLHGLDATPLTASAMPYFADSQGFYSDLIAYVERIYKKLWAEDPDAFDALDMPPDPVAVLRPMAARLTPRKPALCHTDVHQHNIRLQQSGDDLVLIDWELAALGDPCYDLANTINRMNFAPDEADLFLNAYFAASGTDNTPPWRQDVAAYLALEHIQTVIVNGFRLAREEKHPGDNPMSTYERDVRFSRILGQVRQIWTQGAAA